MTAPRHLLRLALALASLLAAAPLTAAGPVARPWSDLEPSVAADVREGRPLVIFVVVPLCDGALIDCGSRAAGRPGDLDTNLYWGAIFGQRRFLDRARSGWERVEVAAGEAPLLERAIYRRRVPAAAWGLGGAAGLGTVEQLLVLQAVHGAAIDQAVARFWSLATQGGVVRFQDGARERAERIHVAGYAGHNRLMDRSAAALPAPGQEGRPIPSFVLACSSDAYFSAPLRSAGSAPLVMTRTLMAPEGYVVDAVARALGDNAPRVQVRSRAVEAYAQWQRMPAASARAIFAP